MEIGDKYVDLRAYSLKFRKKTPISVGKVATESVSHLSIEEMKNEE